MLVLIGNCLRILQNRVEQPCLKGAHNCLRTSLSGPWALYRSSAAAHCGESHVMKSLKGLLWPLLLTGSWSGSMSVGSASSAGSSGRSKRSKDTVPLTIADVYDVAADIGKFFSKLDKLAGHNDLSLPKARNLRFWLTAMGRNMSLNWCKRSSRPWKIWRK